MGIHKAARRSFGGAKPKPQPLDSELISLMALVEARRYGDVEAAARRILSRRPQQPLATKALTFALLGMSRFEEALPILQYALTINPHDPELHNNIGIALSHLMRWDESLQHFDVALKQFADDPEFLKNYGVALARMHRWNDAVPWFLKAIEKHPDDYVEAVEELAAALLNANRVDEAHACFRELSNSDPDNVHALSNWIGTSLRNCEWTDLAQRVADMRRRSENFSKNIGGAFVTLAFPGLTGEEHRAIATHDARPRLLLAGEAMQIQPNELASGRRLRVGYLSGDFRNHAVGVCLAEVIERLSGGRTEIIGYSTSFDDQDGLTGRFSTAFDTFVDASKMSPATLARRIRDNALDILVDLSGWTSHGRQEVLAMRCAATQVNWLGYPGTLGSNRLADYILGDSLVTPADHSARYAEMIAQLPACYLPADSTRHIAARPPREAAGLPANGFVFASFNNSYKFNPPVFDVWCRLLRDVPDSVLWLSSPGEKAEPFLLREVESRGIAATRLLFAPRVKESADHLARLGLADLALDTLPYNAHSTGIDALWAGVPFVTCLGETFAGRVGASLLRAVRLEELITNSLDDYFDLALALARDPQRLDALRRHLADGRQGFPLFDMRRMAGDLEDMFHRMHDMALSGRREPILA